MQHDRVKLLFVALSCGQCCQDYFMDYNIGSVFWKKKKMCEILQFQILALAFLP